MSAKLLVNVRPIGTRVAYLVDGELRDYRIERTGDQKSMVGSVFKGKVSRVLPGMQAAFVDIGLEKAGFLYVGDVRINLDSGSAVMDDEVDGGPQYNEQDIEAKTPIQDLLNQGQEILVQVAKDPLGTKGARITTHVSLPGRFVVYMPSVNHVGISRRIENEEEKDRLKKLVENFKPEHGGIIVRTAAEGAPAEAIKADINYLKLLYDDVYSKYNEKKSVGCIHSELDMELKAVRDLATEEVESVIVDDQVVYDKINNFVTQFIPQLSNKIQFYNQEKLLFDKYGVDIEISRSVGRKVWLKSGGYIIIDEAEALVAIDVNTGSYVGKKDLEDTILKTNLEAVKEVAQQLRIRNVGGIIVIDLIDMEKESHRDKVIEALQDELSKDKSRTNVLGISELGIVEMTRKRSRPSLVKTICEPCRYCEGKGYNKTINSIATEIFRDLEREALDLKISSTKVKCNILVADWIYEEGSDMLEFLETKLQRSILFEMEKKYHIEQYDISSS
ncbi:MAG: ribonuclease E/G [Bdellovibrionales bacterium]